ncbi:MAG: hypothetical protein HOP15_12840 [Planctomycetes bacterium]|nr:hypothetical protein [Planctomycetota bacterium]
MHSLFRAALLVAAPSAPCLSAPALALFPAIQDAPAPGFSLAQAPFPGAPTFGATTTLANGEFVVFDGLDVFQYARDGSLLQHLGAIDTWAFPSFILADPDEDELYVGESSTGKIHRFFVGQHTDPDLLATLPFNYDAAQFDDTALFVSAATCGFLCGNEIWRLDLATNQLRLVARVRGASGPLVFDGAAGLYYAISAAFLPPPPRATKIYRWSAAQLAGGNVLGLADAQFIAGGFEGAARLAFDRRLGALYLVENNFASGANRIRRVLGAPAESPILVEGQPFRSLANLSLDAGTGPAQLRAFQPLSDAVLTYTTSDFVDPPERFELAPRRPALALSGPGASGPGPFTLRLEHGPASGLARVLLFRAAGAQAPERVHLVAGLPLFLGVAPHLFGLATLAGPELFRLRANGGLELDYTNPGGLEGQLAAQLVLYDSAGRVAGTSNVAFL